jgi:hypothetical protein
VRRAKSCVKFLDKRTGWYGEGCYGPLGRAFIKRLEHRHNRRFEKKLTKEET